MDNKPSQLERIRKEHYDKLYARQPQLMNRLIPLLNKADIIQKSTEPTLSSPQDPLENILVTSEPNRNKIDKRKKLREDLNKFSNKMKKSKPMNLNNSKIKKISDIKAKILWGLK